MGIQNYIQDQFGLIPIPASVWYGMPLTGRAGAPKATRVLNYNIEESGTLRKLQVNELEELKNDAYDCART